jgi:hypothetical protein
MLKKYYIDNCDELLHTKNNIYVGYTLSLGDGFIADVVVDKLSYPYEQTQISKLETDDALQYFESSRWETLATLNPNIIHYSNNALNIGFYSYIFTDSDEICVSKGNQAEIYGLITHCWLAPCN